MSHVFNLRKKREEKVQVIPDVMGLKIPDTYMYQFPSWETKEQLLTYLQDVKKGEFVGVEMFLSKELQRLLWVSEYKESHFQSAPPMVFSRQKEDLKNTSLYLVLPVKSSMFTFKMEEYPIWENLKTMLMKHIGDEKVFIQVLCKKRQHDRWKQRINEQYQEYLNGIDEPSDFKFIFKIQQKLNDAFSGEDWKKIELKPLDSVETKCQEDGYHTCIRLAIYGKGESRREYLAEKMLREFRKMNHENEWEFSKVLVNHEGFLDNMQFRRFPLLAGKHTTLCTKEILSFVTCPTEIKKWNQQNEKTIKPKSLEKIEAEPIKQKVKIPSNPFYSLLPLQKNEGKPSFDYNLINRLNHALHRLNILKEDTNLEFQSVVHAPTVQRIKFSMPKGLKLSQLQNATKDIQTELGITNMAFLQGNEAETTTLIFPQSKREVVYLREWIELEEFTQYAKEKELPFFVGVSEEGLPIFEDMARVKHLLIAGATGSGKSVWVNQFLLLLLMVKSPQELLMYLFDPKMVELNLYAEFPHVQEFITEPEEAEQLFSALTKEMDKRYKLFATQRCRNIQQYNRKAEVKMPYILTVIDEYADLKMMSDNIEDEVIRLAQKARACGIHLVVATQRPSVDVITGLLKANLPSRVVFACSSVHDYKTVLDEKPSMKLLGKGHGVAQLEGKQGLLSFQGATISLSEEETDAIIEKLANKLSRKYKRPAPLFEWRKEDLDDEELDEEVDEPHSPLTTTKTNPSQNDSFELIKKIIAETGETRVSKLREQLAIKQNICTEYMQELVREGWLEAPESKRKGYKLLLTEEERKTYLNRL